MQKTLNKLRTIWRQEQRSALAKAPELLVSLATELQCCEHEILLANREDLAKLQADDPMYDRLLLNSERLKSITKDLKQVAELPNPVGQKIYCHKLKGGPKVVLKRVPIGLILVIYESRPNVTLDLFSLALRTGNLLLLKGGKEAFASNSCLTQIIQKQLVAFGLSKYWVHLLSTSRQELGTLLQQHGHIDLCIPRGSANLIRFVRENSQIPTIETGAGVVHLFCDASAQIDMAKKLIANSKLRRLSVCNALDCLLLHRDLLHQLPELVTELSEVTLWTDEASAAVLKGRHPQLKKADGQSFGREFLSAQMCIKTVNDLPEAIEHIAQYGSQHTEVIVTEDAHNAETFCQEVDAAAVLVNMSSGFTDGAQFGLGAEVGISTQKLHARGPMGLEALTCGKWFGRGSGQIRD